jgi:hypothetical protein
VIVLGTSAWEDCLFLRTVMRLDIDSIRCFSSSGAYASEAKPLNNF